MPSPGCHFTKVLGALFSVQSIPVLGANLPPKSFSEMAPSFTSATTGGPKNNAQWYVHGANILIIALEAFVPQ